MFSKSKCVGFASVGENLVRSRTGNAGLNLGWMIIATVAINRSSRCFEGNRSGGISCWSEFCVRSVEPRPVSGRRTTISNATKSGGECICCLILN